MKTLYDVMQLLKSFGVFIYTGDRQSDLDMMEDELRDLYRSGVIAPDDFASALLVLRNERHRKG